MFGGMVSDIVGGVVGDMVGDIVGGIADKVIELPRITHRFYVFAFLVVRSIFTLY